MSEKDGFEENHSGLYDKQTANSCIRISDPTPYTISKNFIIPKTTIDKKTNMIQSWRNYGYCLRGIRYGEVINSNKTIHNSGLNSLICCQQTKQMFQRIYKNLDIPIANCCLESCVFNFGLVTLYKVLVDSLYILTIEDRSNLKNKYTLRLYEGDKFQLENVPMWILEQKVTEIV